MKLKNTDSLLWDHTCNCIHCYKHITLVNVSNATMITLLHSQINHILILNEAQFSHLHSNMHINIQKSYHKFLLKNLMYMFCPSTAIFFLKSTVCIKRLRFIPSLPFVFEELSNTSNFNKCQYNLKKKLSAF